MSEKSWVLEVKKNVPFFLERFRSKTVPGFFRYSFSGDLFSEDTRWGLGNTVFAAKTYYTLGDGGLDQLAPERIDEMVDFIQSFQAPSGAFSDPLIRQRSFFREKLSCFRTKDFENFFHAQTQRAETRQSISALLLLGIEPNYYPKVPQTTHEIDRYLSRLDWSRPWGAGSHFSHLLFLLNNSRIINKSILIDHAIAWVNQIQDAESGSWFKGVPSVSQKINGAMKVLTGFKAANTLTFSYPKELVDLALTATSDGHACDHFNVMYVLTRASEALGHSYRFDEACLFAEERLGQYQKHYWSEYGGFSFHQGRANDYYYKSIISRGLPEPDIHGTVLFLWGISLIEKFLWPEDVLLREFVT